MSDHVFDPEARRAEREKSIKVSKARADRFKADLKDTLSRPEARRILWAFLQHSNVDGTAYQSNAMGMAYGTGLQDGGKWWINAIREFCPEQEAVIRREGLKYDRTVFSGESDDDVDE